MNLIHNEQDEIDEELASSDIWYEAARACDICGEHFTYTDEVFILEIGEAAREADNSISWDILRDADGDYQFEPYMVHFGCWESVVEAIEEMIADAPPMTMEEGILECALCESSIGMFEPLVASTFGELHVSRRSPSGGSTDTLTRLAGPKPVCIACIATVLDDHFEEWEDLLDMIPTPTVIEDE